MRGQLIALLASLLVACTGQDPGETAPPEPPPVGGCVAPAQLMPDGACEVIGIAPEDCAPGFESDEANGCRPVLPPETCPSGQLLSLIHI